LLSGISKSIVLIGLLYDSWESEINLAHTLL